MGNWNNLMGNTGSSSGGGGSNTTLYLVLGCICCMCLSYSLFVAFISMKKETFGASNDDHNYFG